MNIEWNKSFQALAEAFDSIKKPMKLLNTSSSSIQEVVVDRKRKRSCSPIHSPIKSQTITNNVLTWRFATSVSLDSKRLKRLPNPPDNSTETWQSKIQELESNLAMITNTIPTDSYDDIKLIITKIMDIAEWLTAHSFEIESIQSWKFAETSLHNLYRFIRIIEDIKAFNNTNYDHLDIKMRMDIITAKREFYGDLLRQDCIAWTVLGYPIHELKPLITKFQESLFRFNWPAISAVESSMEQAFKEVGLGFWEKPLVMILEVLELITESVQLIGRCPATEQLQIHATNMAVLFLTKTLELFRHLLKHHKRIPDAKVCFLFENLIQLYEYACAYQLSQDAPVMDVVSSTTTSCSSVMIPEQTTEWLISPIYHPAIEAGLELCTFASHPDIHDVILQLCAKYIVTLGDLMEPVLEPQLFSHIQHLL